MPWNQLDNTNLSNITHLNNILHDSTISNQSPPTSSGANSDIRCHLRDPAISLSLRPMVELTLIRSTTVRLHTHTFDNYMDRAGVPRPERGPNHGGPTLLTLASRCGCVGPLPFCFG